MSNVYIQKLINLFSDAKNNNITKMEGVFKTWKHSDAKNNNIIKMEGTLDLGVVFD